MDISPGLSGVHTATVGDGDTAVALGSGDVPVLATPRLIAWLEAAAVAALSAHLEPHETTVGTYVGLDHVAPSHPGTTVTASAVVVSIDGRSIRFRLAAADDGDRTVARGEHDRVLVDRSRFLAT